MRWVEWASCNTVLIRSPHFSHRVLSSRFAPTLDDAARGLGALRTIFSYRGSTRQIQVQTDKGTGRRRHRQTQAQTKTSTDRHRQTQTDTDRHRHTQTDTGTDTDRHRHGHRRRRICTYPQTPKHNRVNHSSVIFTHDKRTWGSANTPPTHHELR